MGLPTADLDCDLAQYADIVCCELLASGGAALSPAHCSSSDNLQEGGSLAVGKGNPPPPPSVTLRLLSPAALLDIPVYKSKVHSLHVLFSLYMEFKNSQVRARPVQHPGAV